MVRGKQMTICWHMDDLKISHIDSREVTKMMKVLENKCGKMKTTCGKVHNYLGIMLDCRKRGKVKVGMVKYTKEVVEAFPEKIKGSVTTPAANHLFEVNKNCSKLSEEKGRVYHTTMATLLFSCKRARQDIQTAVAFLTARVKELDKDDWKKQRCVLMYLNRTINLVTTLTTDKLNVAK
eukprot:13293928-Ditylum_brightwellii.AAC.1